MKRDTMKSTNSEIFASSISEYSISLQDIKFRGKHGVSASERELLQDFSADLEIVLPTKELPTTDRYEEVFDYDKLAKLVVEEGTSQSFQLLEMLAKRILFRIFQETPALSVSIAIAKSKPPTTPSVESVKVRVKGAR